MKIMKLINPLFWQIINTFHKKKTWESRELIENSTVHSRTLDKILVMLSFSGLFILSKACSKKKVSLGGNPTLFSNSINGSINLSSFASHSIVHLVFLCAYIQSFHLSTLHAILLSVTPLLVAKRSIWYLSWTQPW